MESTAQCFQMNQHIFNPDQMICLAWLIWCHEGAELYIIAITYDKGYMMHIANIINMDAFQTTQKEIKKLKTELMICNGWDSVILTTVFF